MGFGQSVQGINLAAANLQNRKMLTLAEHQNQMLGELVNQQRETNRLLNELLRREK